MSFTSIGATSAAISALLLTPVAAANPASVPQVNVKGDYDARRDDTASRIVVRRDEIAKYGDSNVIDVLKRLPGVTISGSASRGAEIRLRGLGSGYTQILLNNAKLPAGFQLDTLSPEQIEQIEVLRAPTADLSTQSIAGTINIVLKQAVRDLGTELKTSMASGEGGGLSPRVHLQRSGRDGGFSYAWQAALSRNSFERVAPYVEDELSTDGSLVLLRHHRFHDDGHSDAFSLNPRFNWTMENGAVISSQTNWNINRFHRLSDLEIATPLGRHPVYPVADDAIRWSNQFLRSELSYTGTDSAAGKLETKISTSLGRLTHDLWQQGYSPDRRTKTLDSVVNGDGSERGVTVIGKYAAAPAAGHKISAGWDVGTTARDDTRDERALSFEEYGVRQHRYAVYVQDEWTVATDWSVYLGWRWESLDMRIFGSHFPLHRYRSSVASPILQTLFKLPNGKGKQLRVSLASTFKSPGLNMLMPRRFASANNSQTELDFEGNPLLKPERATGMDISYEHWWDKSAMLSIALWARSIHDVTRSDTVRGGDGRWVSRPINDGRARSRGLEIEWKFPVPALSLDVRASLARNWSSVAAVPGPDNRLDQQTPVSANLGLDRHTREYSFGASFAYRAGGMVRQSLRQFSYSENRRELDLYVLWKAAESMRLRLSVNNALGEDGISHRLYADAGLLQRRMSTFPASPVVRAGLELKF